MKRVHESVLDAVGNTPLLRLSSLEKDAPGVEIWLKLEFTNPGGSVKDRAASRMMTRALADGRLSGGKILIDSTSGNTGIAYSLFGAALGVPVQLVMPSNVSKARKDIARAFGTHIIFSDPMEGSDGAIRHVQKIVAENPDKYFYPDQYGNADNPGAHYHGTAVEILDALGDRITHFVTGIGTSGTIMGTSRRLREQTRAIECIALEPEDAFHGLEGLKHLPSSIVPAIHDASGYHRTMRVATEAGWDMTERLAAEEALFVGHSTGANVYAALVIAKSLSGEGKPGCVVTIACDRADRYFEPMKWETKSPW